MQIEPEWEPIGDADPLARLLATIWVHGCPLHLEARQVVTTEDGQTPVEYPEDYEALCALYSPDGRFATFIRDGREYIAFAAPYSR